MSREAVGWFSHIVCAAKTDVGKKRKNNEDAYGVFHEAGVFCVADGMGGGDDGEIASAAVVKGLEDGLKALPFREDGGYAAADVADVVETSLTKASAWIFNRTRQKNLSGCGSTFVGFALDATSPGTALAIHAGDSRLYLLHGRSIKQVTHDHSVAEMIGAKDESKVNPMFRSMVMNAIGIRAKADPERTPFKVSAGDRILVCSDGLSRMVPDKKILAISRKNEDVAKAADALIAAALEAGGVDNVTVVLTEVGELPAAVPALEPPPDAGGELATGSSDRTTGETGGDATEDSTQTLATMAPTMTGDALLVPEESDEPVVAAAEVSAAANSAQRSQSLFWRKQLIALAAVAAVGLLAAVVLGMLAKRSPAPKDEPPAARQEQPLAAMETLPADPPHPEPVQKAVVIPEPELPPAPKPVPMPEVRSVPTIVTNLPAVVTNALDTVTNAPAAVEAFEAVVKACEGDSLESFCQAFRRLEGKVKPELREQMKRFEASARFCARMRTKDGAVRAVVDLRYCLEAAAGARKSLEASTRPVARRLLVAWDELIRSEPSSDEGMKAATRFLSGVQETGDR